MISHICSETQVLSSSKINVVMLIKSLEKPFMGLN